jgi:hypothetical protein
MASQEGFVSVELVAWLFDQSGSQYGCYIMFGPMHVEFYIFVSTAESG